jgi:hypothetical protein
VTGREDGPGEDRAGRQADAERLMGDASQLAARAAGRACEELEEVWAEVQALRHQGSGVGRRTLAYGIAGLINLGERVAGAARGAAEGARAVQDQAAKPPDADDQRS